MTKFHFILLLTIVLTQSCSLAPFSPTTSGRSYGQGNLQANIGQANNNFYMKFGVGLSENFDTGFVTEFGTLATSALFFRYSIINQPTGLSWNTEAGYGSTGSTTLYYVGTTASIAFSETLEIFAGGRINNVSTDEADIDLGDYYGNVKVTEYELVYLQFTYGMNVWLGNGLGLSLYNTHFSGDELESKQDATFGAAFLYKI